MPPMLDQVLLHEATHAMMEETGVNDLLSQVTGGRRQVLAEETMAWFLERVTRQAGVRRRALHDRSVTWS